MNQRQVVLTVASVLTLVAALWTAWTTQDEPLSAVSLPTRPGQVPPAASAAMSSPMVPDDALRAQERVAWPPLGAEQRAVWGVVAEASVPQAFVPPPMPSLAPFPEVAPLPPQAPDFPYRLMGGFDDGAARQAFLDGAGRSLVVKVGAVIDGEWRIERIDETQVVMLWIPGNQPKTIAYTSP